MWEVDRRGPSAMALSPDGARVVTVGCDVKGWDFASGRLQWRANEVDGGFFPDDGEEHLFRGVAFHPDGSYVATALKQEVVLWNAATGKKVRQFEGITEDIDRLAFSPDGTWLAARGDGETAVLWDVKTGRLRHVFDELYDLDDELHFSDDGKTLITAGSGTIEFWDVESGELRGKIETSSDNLALSPDGKNLAVIDDGELALWNLDAGKPIRRFTVAPPECTLTEVVFSPSGRMIALGGENCTIGVFDVASGEPLHQTAGHASPVRTMVLHPDGATLISGGDDLAVMIWDLATGRQQARISRAEPVTWLALSPNGRQLAAGNWMGNTFAVFGLPQPAGEPRFERSIEAEVDSGVFSPNGQTLLTGLVNNDVVCWDPTSGQPRRTLVERNYSVLEAAYGDCHVAFHPRRPVVACTHKTFVELLNFETGMAVTESITAPDSMECLAFDPSGSRIASGTSDGKVMVWSAATGKMLHRLETKVRRQTWSVAFHPSGRVLAASYNDGIVRFWDTEEGTPLQEIAIGPVFGVARRGGFAPVRQVAYTHDGNRLLTGNANSTIYVLPSDSDTGLPSVSK